MSPPARRRPQRPLRPQAHEARWDHHRGSLGGRRCWPATRRRAMRRPPRRCGGKYDVGMDLQQGLDPMPLSQADLFHSTDSHASQHDGTADVQSPHSAEACGQQGTALTEIAFREPKGAGHHQDQKDEDGRTNDHFIAALHAPAPAESRSLSLPASGRPSMNCRTMGSWVRWTCSTVPT